ncbi:hypothetical protein BDQ17DRAFT_1344738, partial [Cyathus striatus]
SYPPPTLIEQWERAHRTRDLTQKPEEGRDVYPSDLTQFLTEFKDSIFVLDSNPGTVFESHSYRVGLSRKAATIFCTLSIQTNEPNPETVCNLHASVEDIKAGWITAEAVKEAFRNMFETRRWNLKQGGHMTIFRDERPSSETKGAVVYVFGRPMVSAVPGLCPVSAH